MLGIWESRVDNSFNSAYGRVKMRVGQHKVGGSATAPPHSSADRQVVSDTVGTDTRVILAHDMLQVTLRRALITGHLDLGVAYLARVRQLIRSRTRRYRIIFTESNRLDGELHRLVLVDLFLLDPLGDRVTDLLPRVVARPWHIDHEHVYLLSALGALEGSGPCGSQDAIVFLADGHGVAGFVLTRSQLTAYMLIVKPFDPGSE